jgi:predicted GH43/DUF377 family glycosyl hydrolase
MEDSTITFVTSYMNIYETPFENRTFEWRTQNFRDILSTGIQLYVFISPEYEEAMEEMTRGMSNVILKSVDLKSMEIYKDAMGLPEGTWELPKNRTVKKDTNEYILLMNSKAEFVHRAIEENPWNSTHFSWIDFNIAYIFKNKVETLEYLRVLGRRQFTTPHLAIPGCWGKLPADDVGRSFNDIHWRFCGGFFLGDRDSLIRFYQLYREFFPRYLEESHRLVWEVNFWAWLEVKQDWSPNWYLADHNDTMIHMSSDAYTPKIYDVATFEEYEYPRIERYYPTSASYVYHEGRHWLNTRYVSYWLYANGVYYFNHPDRIIENKNMISELDEDMHPISHFEMEEAIDMPEHAASFSKGLEDIRLYSVNGGVKFVATTVSYSPSSRCRIMNGDYDVYTHQYSNCRILDPPNPDSYCEKNWIPLIRNSEDGVDEEFFIYKWKPLEIGKVDPATNTLAIVEKFQVNAPLFHKVRGSTPFIECEDGLLALVHLSEEHSPRHYYHMLVLLEKNTFRPLKYSRTFCFRTLGVEFCVGFRIAENEKYVFWISRHDRDPMMVRVGRDEIPLVFQF